ncbi:hypothetical protein [Nocardia exalbida]|uniref:hypothetical protein n=1 Tax=Nocardia exalbida TaxID=290231 RepID=UPI0002D5A96B|nr:hypothetical protein [Nocardia exalbida]
MRKFLAEQLPVTLRLLDQVGTGNPEGIVLRAQDRSVIAKARVEDYDRASADAADCARGPQN